MQYIDRIHNKNLEDLISYVAVLYSLDIVSYSIIDTGYEDLNIKIISSHKNKV
ncbi:MAG: hypothetical protein GY793_02145 [Proteobacteria bacterium]|nr:hypothetical protein [Pseudomonadota bacterium]